MNIFAIVKCSVDMLRYSYIKTGHRFVSNHSKCLVTRAIDDCIAEGVLKDFLIERKSEVLEMVLYSFDKELYEKDLKQIAFEKGEQNKLISQVQKKLAKGKSIEEIADALEESVETVKSIIDTLQ